MVANSKTFLQEKLKELRLQTTNCAKEDYNSSEFIGYIEKNHGKNVIHFLLNHLNLADPHNLIISTTTLFNIIKLPSRYYRKIANLRRINDIPDINKFFETVNSKLQVNGTFIGCVETKNQRKKKILKKYPKYLNYIAYTLDFIIKRVFPKLPFTKKIYFILTRGNNQVISRAEALGRLYYCGFEVAEEQFIRGYLYFVVRKVKKPLHDPNPTFGALIKLGRVGKNGEIIKVYKFRTMHPYSEYLQEYVYKNHYLKEGGKFNNDFRLLTLGKIFRKYWLDEIPMLLNLLKGEIKLVGVRPLSIHYYSLYTEELQRKRIQFKPGLIPPFYADLPNTLEGIMESEMNYLKQYEKQPLKTDVKYFFLAVCNILFKQSRSN